MNRWMALPTYCIRSVPDPKIACDRPFFRCSGCPVQVRFSEGTWLFRTAAGRWRLPSLPSRLPSDAT
jgi:hypothetical protein